MLGKHHNLILPTSVTIPTDPIAQKPEVTEVTEAAIKVQSSQHIKGPSGLWELSTGGAKGVLEHQNQQRRTVGARTPTHMCPGARAPSLVVMCDPVLEHQS